MKQSPNETEDGVEYLVYEDEMECREPDCEAVLPCKNRIDKELAAAIGARGVREENADYMRTFWHHAWCPKHEAK